jgi:cyclophilin family peptidyl-prolyl cis-trans isomerase
MTHRAVAAAVCLLLVVACGGSGGSPVASTEYERFRSQTTACGAAAPAAARELSYTAADELGITGAAVATVHTSCGDIVIELHADTAPVTVNSFAFLAEQGYFDGTVSHRIVPGFVVQLGDPTATGTGFPGYRIPDELPPADFTYTTGVVAMANGGPNTGGSQFFIVFDDIVLDPDYTVFGQVLAGLDVLQRIAAIPVAVNPRTLEPSLPLETLYIESVTIDR